MLQTFGFLPIRQQFTRDIFGIPHDIRFSQEILDDYYPSHQHFLSSKSIVPVWRTYVTHAYQELSRTITTASGALLPSKLFLIPAAYNAAAKAFFGDAFPADKTYRDFEAFNNVLHIVAPGFPRFFLAGSYHRWNRVITIMKDYVANLRREKKRNQQNSSR